MDIFQEILKKAENDGQLDPRLADSIAGRKSRFWNIKKLPLPPVLMTLPEKAIYDLQKIMENIRQIGESKTAQIIGFTSAIPNQGTSSVLSLISLLLAAREKMSYEQVQKQRNGDNGKYPYQHGVLLMDGQLRNPSIHHKFGLPQSGGILEVLENQLPTNRLMKSIESSALKIVTTGIYKNFHLAQNHLEKLDQLLMNARRRVKFIFVDIPPVLTYSEGISLSRLCDGVIMVMQSGDIRWEVMQEARRYLERAGIQIYGGILNRREYHIPSWVYKNI
jgi:Mrp family chromosome partitioning ATPase